MKKTIVHSTTTLLPLLVAFLFISGQAFSQKTGTRITTSDTGDGGITSVTKIFEFSTGGLDISTISGDVTYTVFEKKSKTSTWVETNDGTQTIREKQRATICKGDSESVKVEIKMACDGCASVRQTECH